MKKYINFKNKCYKLILFFFIGFAYEYELYFYTVFNLFSAMIRLESDLVFLYGYEVDIHFTQ